MTSLHPAMNLERKMLSAAKASLHSAMNQSVRCDRRESGTSIVTIKRTPVSVRGFSLRGQKQQRRRARQQRKAGVVTADVVVLGTDTIAEATI